MVTLNYTDIYCKLKYTLMPCLHVFKYICNYTFVMIKMQNVKYINIINAL